MGAEWLPELFWDSDCSAGIAECFLCSDKANFFWDTASSWHDYLENSFASILKQVPRAAFGIAAPFLCRESWELVHCHCHQLQRCCPPSPYSSALAPRADLGLSFPPNTDRVTYVPFAQNLPWLCTLQAAPGGTSVPPLILTFPSEHKGSKLAWL